MTTQRLRKRGTLRSAEEARNNNPRVVPYCQRTRVRTLFISDVHLGTRACQAELLISFLRCYEAQTLFLVGDIMEHWCLTSTRHWNSRHTEVIGELLAMAERGTRIIYIPGNHDDEMRRCAGLAFSGIEIELSALHKGADGLSYLVTHGDQFDVVLRHTPWLASIGHVGYHMLLATNTSVNRVRRWLGLEYWSLSEWAKHKIKQVVNHIGHFEDCLSAEARQYGADGVVCGHIHHAADRDLDGIRYLNSGNWVETCSAIIESTEGRFQVVYWNAAAAKAHNPPLSHLPQPANNNNFEGEDAGLDIVRHFQLWIRRTVVSRSD